TGSEWSVWGRSPSGVARGARYDPATDSWTIMRDAPASPTPRTEHTAVWTGAEMIIWGGSDFNPVVGDVYTGGRYNPATDTWAATGFNPALTDGRGVAGHAAVWTGSEMFVCGGIRWALSAFHNPVSDSWRTAYAST